MAADPQVATAVVAVPRAGGRTDATVAATAALVLLLLVIFVVWPVLRVLGMSLTSPAGLTLAHYAEFRSEEHTSELHSHSDLVCRLLLETKKKNKIKWCQQRKNKGTKTRKISS